MADRHSLLSSIFDYQDAPVKSVNDVSGIVHLLKSFLEDDDLIIAGW